MDTRSKRQNKTYYSPLKFDNDDDLGMAPPKKLRRIRPRPEVVKGKTPLRRLLNTVLTHPKRFPKVDLDAFKQAVLDLDNLVGLSKAKETVADQIRFLLTSEGNMEGHFLHTILTGEPGSGKTTLARHLGKIYAAVRPSLRDSKSPFIEASRETLIAKYLGQTAVKTKAAYDSARGGVLFIDEAYSLICGDSDDYGHEAITTLTTLITQESQQQDVVVILAGYKNDMDRLLQQSNQGLRRRFPWRFEIERPTSEELYNILEQQLAKHEWKIDEQARLVLKEFIANNRKYFKHNGGSTDALALRLKMAHVQGVFPFASKRVICEADVKRAMPLYVSMSETTNLTEIPPELQHIYL